MSTFSRTVMFWNSRMFWNVRPMPASTMSFGRALLKTPRRRSSRSYQGGRTMPMSRLTIRTASAAVDDEQLHVGVLWGQDPCNGSRTRSAMTAGTNQTNGSIHARSARATIRRPRNVISPSLGSRMPATTLKKVVLPAPFGPMRLTMDPWGIDQLRLVHGYQPAKTLGDGPRVHQDGSRVCIRRRVVLGQEVDRWFAHASSPRPSGPSGSAPSTSAPAGSSVTCSSWARRRLGNRPSGRRSIMPTSASP